MSLHCPKCGEATGVRDSRSNKVQQTHSVRQMVRRRRECGNCKHRFTTLELHESVLREMVAAQARLALLQDAISGRKDFDKTPKIKSLPHAVEHFNKEAK